MTAYKVLDTVLSWRQPVSKISRFTKKWNVLKKRIGTKIRIKAFTAINNEKTFHKYVEPLIIYLARKGIIKFLFLVTPGTQDQIDHFCPGELAKIAYFPRLIDCLIKNFSLFAVTLATSRSSDQLVDKASMIEIVKWMEDLCERCGGIPWTFSGANPALVEKYGIQTRYLMDGRGGVTISVLQTMKKAGIPDDAKIMVIGSGHVGKFVIDDLVTQGFTVLGGLDKMNQHGAGLEVARDMIHQADVAIVLTYKGEEIEPYVEMLVESGVITVDDTHPQVPERFRAKLGSLYYKVVGTFGGVRHVLGLPRLGIRELPGCCVWAIFRTLGIVD